MRKYAPPTENYFRMYNKVFDLNLRATTFLLYSYLLCCAGNKGYCWPSLETISRKTGLSVSTIQDHLKILERRKLIRKTKHPTALFPVVRTEGGCASYLHQQDAGANPSGTE